MTIRTIVILLIATISIVSSGRLVQAAPTDKIEQKSFAKTLYETLWKVHQCHPDLRGVIFYKGISASREMLRRKLDGLLIEVRCNRHRLEAAYISFYPSKNIEELEPRDLETMEFVYGSTYYPRPYQISPKTAMKVMSDHPFVKEVMEAVVRFYPGGCTKNEWTRRPWGDHGYEMIEAAYSCRAMVGSDYIDLFAFSGRYFPEYDFVKLNLIHTTQLVVN